MRRPTSTSSPSTTSQIARPRSPRSPSAVLPPRTSGSGREDGGRRQSRRSPFFSLGVDPAREVGRSQSTTEPLRNDDTSLGHPGPGGQHPRAYGDVGRWLVRALAGRLVADVESTGLEVGPRDRGARTGRAPRHDAGRPDGTRVHAECQAPRSGRADFLPGQLFMPAMRSSKARRSAALFTEASRRDCSTSSP